MPRATRTTYNVPFRRRREGRTNYSKRIALLKHGDRLVIRKTTRTIIAQLVSYSGEGDRIILSFSSKDLAGKFNLPRLKNIFVAYLVGYAIAKRAVSKGIKHAVLDVGRRTPTKSSFVFAALKGAVDGGLEVPHSPSIFDADRFSGGHIAAYAKSLKESNPEEYRRKFSQYIAKGINPAEIPKLVDQIKSKL